MGIDCALSPGVDRPWTHTFPVVEGPGIPPPSLPTHPQSPTRPPTLAPTFIPQIKGCEGGGQGEGGEGKGRWGKERGDLARVDLQVASLAALLPLGTAINRGPRPGICPGGGSMQVDRGLPATRCVAPRPGISARARGLGGGTLFTPPVDPYGRIKKQRRYGRLVATSQLSLW